MASQTTSLTIVYSTVYSRRRTKIHLSSASLAFVRGIDRRPVKPLHKEPVTTSFVGGIHRSQLHSPYKGPVTRKMFPLDDVIIIFLRNYYQHFETWLRIYISAKWIILWTFGKIFKWNCNGKTNVLSHELYLKTFSAKKCVDAIFASMR